MAELDQKEDVLSLGEKMGAFIGRHEQEVKRRIQARVPQEQIWFDDLLQYHGLYDREKLQEMKGNKQSYVNINQTRPKTDAFVARCYDFLFPTDDRNWSIQPTPVPELMDATQNAESVYDESRERLSMLDDRMAAVEESDDQDSLPALQKDYEDTGGVVDAAKKELDRLHEVMAEAEKRCEGMAKEIEDQLKESKFQAECRRMIEDAAKIGFGVIKGPILGEAKGQRYREVQPGVYQLSQEFSEAPGVKYVDPWSFFPDPDQKKLTGETGFYERHLMTKSGLRRFAKRPDVDENVIRVLLRDGTDKEADPSYLVDLRNMAETESKSGSEYFHMWEYTGPIDHEDLDLVARAFADEALAGQLEDLDILEEIHVKLWFCQGKLASFALHPLDSNEPIYSKFCVSDLEAGPYGVGIPRMMADAQAMLNAAVRAMMDNAALSVAPQIIMNKEAVTPQDGTWQLRPRKIWLLNTTSLSGDVPITNVFRAENIPMQQAELMNIIEMSMRFIDDVTSIPRIVQGERGSGVTETAQGTAMLINGANITLRRTVRNFDDDVTAPIIRRFYHWNMQFSENDAIKGDYEVDARGSTSALVREMQSANLIMIARMFGDHPVYGPMIKHEELLSEIFKAHSVPVANILRTDRELREMQEQTKPDPVAQATLEAAQEANELKREEIGAKVSIENMKNETAMLLGMMRGDIDLQSTILIANAKIEEAEARGDGNDASEAYKLVIAQLKAASEKEKVESKERQIAVEAAMAERTGQHAGGAI